MKKKTELKPAEIQRYTHMQMADMYQVCRQTLYRWLRPLRDQIGPRKGQWYSAEQVETIFAEFGVPLVAVSVEVFS